MAYSCMPKLDTNISSNFKVPIIHTSLKVDNLVNEEYLQTDTNGLVHLSINPSFLDFNMQDMFAIPDKGIEKSFTVDSLSLADNEIIYPITLADIARNIGGIGGIILLASHNSESAIPAIDSISAGEVDVNANDFFHEAILEEGKMIISIENTLPIEINNLSYIFKNKGDQTEIASGNFAVIEPNSFQVDTFDLSGKRIEGDLEISLSQFSSPGTDSASVPIDTNDAITVKLEVKDLQVYEATAVFPTQNLVNDNNNMMLEDFDARLTEIKAASGSFIVDVYSTAQDSLFFEYNFPYMIRNGESFSNTIAIDPGSAENPSTIRVEFDLRDYVFDMRGLYLNTFNAIGSQLRVYIDSSGQVTTLSKADSFYILYTFTNLEAEYIKGYIFPDTLAIDPDTSSFELLEDFNFDLLRFESATSNLSIENGLGIEANLKIDTLVGIGNSSSIALSNNEIRSIAVNSASNVESIETSITEIALNDNNSNFTDFINNFPNSVFYEGEIILNPNDDQRLDQFISKESAVNLGLNIDIPLNVRIENFILIDTIDIVSSNQLDMVQTGGLEIKYQNTFPFSMDLSLILTDSNLQVLDSLSINETLQTNENISTTKIQLNESQMNHFKQSHQIIIQAKINSKNAPDFVQIKAEHLLNIQAILEAEILLNEL